MLANPDGYENFSAGGAYYQWQTIALAPETGAVCGNGSEYKFFVNRVPNTSNTVVYFEGGGAAGITRVAVARPGSGGELVIPMVSRMITCLC